MNLRVQHLMHRDVVKVRGDMTLEELDRTFSENAISGAPVVSHEGIAQGLVSQTDIVRFLARYKTRAKQPLNEAAAMRLTLVSEIMERRLHSVGPDDDISTAAGLMRRFGIHRLLVLDEGHVIGILSALDLVRVLEDVDFFQEYYGVLDEARAQGRKHRARRTESSELGSKASS